MAQSVHTCRGGKIALPSHFNLLVCVCVCMCIYKCVCVHVGMCVCMTEMEVAWDIHRLLYIIYTVLYTCSLRIYHWCGGLSNVVVACVVPGLLRPHCSIAQCVPHLARLLRPLLHPHPRVVLLHRHIDLVRQEGIAYLKHMVPAE